MFGVMNLRLCLVGLGLAGCLAAADAQAQTIDARIRTNAVSTSPGEEPDSLKNFQVKPGFRLELVAVEPLVANPIAMAFDENGRLFVLEQTDISAPGETRKGRVRLLEASGTNGIFDSSTVYADNLTNLTALACFGGGVFVGSAGQIIYLKDTKNDGLADLRVVVFKSFGDAANGSGGDVIITSMAWGLDNRMHVTTASRSGDVISSSSPVQSIILREGSFAFDPRRYLLTDETGGGLSGICFDNRGRKFVCSPTDHLEMIMYQAGYAERNPFYEMPGVMLDLVGNGPASLIHPLNPRTPVSHFSSAGGLTIYRGNTFPPEYLGDAFVADAVAGVVHHDKLRQVGIELVAERPADEITTEFLASSDGSFQPTQVINGPDGALYIAGLTRENVPAVKSKKTNSNIAGSSTRGRIYRVVPVNFKQPTQAQLGKATGEQLVSLLRHPNGWQRDTAARLLYERQDRTAIAPLIRLLFDPNSPPLARMHSMHVLDGQQFSLGAGRPARALLESHIVSALGDVDDRVREHAVLLAERFMTNGTVSDQLWDQLTARAGDPSPQVRYQLAFTLGQAQHDGRVQVLVDTLRTDLNDRWLQAAVLSSLKEGAGDMLGLLSADANVRSAEDGPEFLRQLVSIVGAKNQPAEITPVFNYLSRVPEPELAFNLALTLGNRLQRANSSAASADAQGALKSICARAVTVALNLSASDSARTAALRLLTATGYADPGLAAGLVQEWTYFSAGLRQEALATLLARPDRTAVLLLWVQNGLVSPADFSAPQARFVLGHPDQSIRQQAATIFGMLGADQRQGVVNRFLPAVQLPGRLEQGRQIFAGRCAACHQTAGQRNSDGLGLADAVRAGKEQLLIRILDPNRKPQSNHPETLIETRDGATLTGFIEHQKMNSVTICDINGVRWAVGVANIQRETNLGFSGMPAGLEAGLNQQDMADLLEYLTVNPP
jgi:putative membrane-bound dehydrogenase-like protein